MSDENFFCGSRCTVCRPYELSEVCGNDHSYVCIYIYIDVYIRVKRGIFVTHPENVVKNVV